MTDDPFSRHEALQMASVMCDFFERHLAEHAHVRASPALGEQAAEITDLLARFYQAIGAQD